MTGMPTALRCSHWLRPALAAILISLSVSNAGAQSSTFMREDLPAPAALEERGRAVIREELDPVMSADGSGLPHELWSGLSAQAFAEAIAQLSLPPKSPTLQGLWARLIGSETIPLAGVEGARFTALRIEALERSGLIDEVAAVLARDPAGTSDPLLLALTARSEIGLGNTERGCEIARGLRSAQSGLPKPMQADVILINGYCAAASGDTAAAGIQASLLKDLDLGLAGADFLDAVASGLKPEISKDASLSLLDYRVASLGGDLPGPTLIAAAQPALLAGLAQDPRVAPDTRLAAGERAIKLNVLSAQDLAPLYRADGAGGDAGTIERAGLLKSAEGEKTPLQKSRLIRAFLDEARAAGFYWQALQLMAGPTQSLEPAPEIGWFAETGVEVNLANGNFEGARRWASFIDAPYTANRPSAPLAHWIALVDIADPAMSSGRDRSLAALEALAGRGQIPPDLLHRFVTVLDALDIAVPMPLWDFAGRVPQPAGGHLPDTGVLSELADASAKKQFGRTVLLVMRTIGPDTADGAHMIALGDALRALQRAGLKAEARQLAVEALFTAWPRAVGQ